MKPPQVPQIQTSDAPLNQFQAKLAAILNPFFKSLGLALGSVGTIRLTVQTAAGGVLAFSGQLFDGNANAITSQPLISIRTLAKTATEGAITVKSGTEILNTGVPAGVSSQAIIRVNADGTFAITIADGTSGDVVYCEVIASGVLPAAQLLTGF